MKRFVEDAVVEKRFVVVAFVVVEFVAIRFGNVLFEVVVAVKYAATVSPTTDSFAYGDVVPMPTEPFRIVFVMESLPNVTEFEPLPMALAPMTI